MTMDKKEQHILKHYKTIIEGRTFTEYDIIGFLIFIRRYTQKEKNKYIREFCDLIAHRKRDRGVVFDSIISQYGIKGDLYVKIVPGYHGIQDEKWSSEWTELMQELNIAIDDQILKEITLCIFSLSQFSVYTDKNNGYSGEVHMIQHKDQKLGLATSVNDETIPYVCFGLINDVTFIRVLPFGLIVKPTETIRKNGKLYLSDEDGDIISV